MGLWEDRGRVLEFVGIGFWEDLGKVLEAVEWISQVLPSNVVLELAPPPGCLG